jgi:hypothetical protein
VHVIRLDAENFMRLHAVSIEPSGNVVTISGANASGKTSCLNAIAVALGGASVLKGTPQPIRRGENEAYIRVELDEIVVERHFTRKGEDEHTTRLVVTAKDGSRYSSPQQFLDERLGKLSFDPLAFANSDAKTQRQTLLNVVDVAFKVGEESLSLEQYDQRRQKVYDDRTVANREVKTLEGKVAGIARPDDVPAEVDVTDLLDERREGEQSNRAMDQHREYLERCRTDVQIAERALEIAREALATAEQVALPAAIDLAAIDERIRLAGDANRTAAGQRAALEKFAELDAARNLAARLDTQLGKIDAYKAKCLAAVEMPVEGLGFGEDGVTYRGLPLSQASAAEQLRVSVGIGMALNPEIRVLLIRDGSLLDASNMALLKEMAGDRDYQLFVERVSDGQAVGFVVEDGRVSEMAR